MMMNREKEKDYNLLKIGIDLKIQQSVFYVQLVQLAVLFFWTADTYVGPAAIVNAHRFVFDSRDNASKQRLEILQDIDGAFR